MSDERRTGVAPGGQSTVRLAVIDSDTGFLQVLGKRLEGMGWQYRVLASPVPLDAMVAMRLNAVVVDLAVLGPQGWTYLDKLCARLPGLGVIVCTGQSSVAQRVRGLRLGADDWVTKPCHPEELIARVEAVVRRRKRADVRVDKGPVMIGEVEIRADQFQAFVGGVSVELTRREFELIQLLGRGRGAGPAARGDLPARVGLRHGPRRSLGRRLRAQAAFEAREGLVELALHPHPLRHRLPLLGGARRGAGRLGAARAGARRRRRGLGERSRPSRPLRSPSPISSARARVDVRWDRTATRTSATSRSSSRSPSPSGSSRAAAPAPTTISNIFSVLFLGGLFWLGYRLYMEHRDTILGLEERQRGMALRRLRPGRLRPRRHRPPLERPRHRSAACSGC